MQGAIESGWLSYIQAGGAVAQVTGALLLVMSLASWYWIVLSAQRMVTRKLQARAVVAALGSGSLERAQAALGEAAAVSPFGAMVHAALAARQHLPQLATAHSNAPDYVARTLAQVLEREQIRLERGLTALASIAASAPFVGLFGTVVGIYRALINIGTSGNASLASVALPVGEALVMTALGLAVAIPAVLGYNACQRLVRTSRAALEDLGYTLHIHVCAGVPLPVAASPSTRVKSVSTESS